jgi:hypothetical protein
MPYMNPKTGEDNCPKIKLDNLKKSHANSLRVLSRALARDEKLSQQELNINIAPLYAWVKEHLNEEEIKDCLTSDRVKQLAELQGVTRVTSGIWGAEHIARKLTQQKYGEDIHVCLGDKEQRWGWGYYIKGAEAYGYYLDKLRYNLEWLVGRRLGSV